MLRTIGSRVKTNKRFGVDQYTKLLVHADSPNDGQNFTDASGVGQVLTANGNAKISAEQSKFGGGAMKFDGSGDYVSVANLADFAFPGDFSLDFWWYNLAFSPATSTPFNIGTYAEGVCLYISNTLTSGVLYIVGSGNALTWPALALNTWYHWAICRQGNQIYVFLNGTIVGGAPFTNATATGTASGVRIGNDIIDPAAQMNGYVDEFRAAKGVAYWTSNFIPPTRPYTR